MKKRYSIALACALALFLTAPVPALAAEDAAAVAADAADAADASDTSDEAMDLTKDVETLREEHDARRVQQALAAKDTADAKKAADDAAAVAEHATGTHRTAEDVLAEFERRGTTDVTADAAEEATEATAPAVTPKKTVAELHDEKRAKRKAKREAKEARREAREAAERYVFLLTDSGYNYYLDNRASRWAQLPHGDELILDTWIRLLPQETEDEAAASGTYSYPQKYYLAHYYLRPKTQQIQFLGEFEVTGGRPDNTVQGHAYDARNWEDLIPDSIEDEIYRRVMRRKKAPKSRKIVDYLGGPRNLHDAIEEYLHISI